MDRLNQISLLKLSKYCRTCFSECEDEGYNVEEFPEPLFRLFMQCVPYERSQKNLTNLLCPLCYDTLKNFEEFRSKALARTYLLERFLKTQNLTHVSEKTNTNLVQKKLSSEEAISTIPGKTICSASEGNALAKWNDTESSGKYEQVLHSKEAASIVSSKSVFPASHNETVGKRHDIESSEQFEEVQNFEEILMNTAAETDEKPLKCQLNGNKRMKTKSKRKGSFAETAKSDKKNLPKHWLYTCSYCDRSFQYTMTLSKHLTETHNLKPTFTLCPHKNCNKAFQHDEAATQHYRYNHQMEIPKDTLCICELCGQTFENEKKLKHHHYKHEPNARPFHCEICDKRFVLRSSFKEHQLRHAGIKAYECPHCKTKKTSARELRAHMNCHSKDKQYPCSLCPRVFRWPQALRVHDRIVHKGIRRFICRYCDQAFGKPENLKYHERRHTGEKPFDCKLCGLKFISYAALQNHSKTKSHIKKTQENDLAELADFRESPREVDVSIGEKE